MLEETKKLRQKMIEAQELADKARAAANAAQIVADLASQEYRTALEKELILPR